MDGLARLSLSILPPEDRFPFWHDYGSRLHRPIRSNEIDYSNLNVEFEFAQLGDVGLGKMKATPQRYERTTRMIKEDRGDHISLIAVEKGSVTIECGSRIANANAGDIILFDSSLPCQSRWSQHSVFILNIPRRVFANHCQYECGHTSRLLHSDSAAKLLLLHINALWSMLTSNAICKDKSSLGSALAAQAKEYFKEKITQKDRPSNSSDKILLLQAIKSWIDDNLHGRDLSPENIAMRFSVSRSYLYRLFSPYDGVANYVNERRLERAYYLLASGLHKESLASLAAQFGYSSQPAFTKSFTRRWGITPSQARKLQQEKTQYKDNMDTTRKGQPQPNSYLADISDSYYRPLGLKRD